MDIPIRVISSDINATEAVRSLYDKYDVQTVNGFEEVERNALLVLSCPEEAVQAFRFHRGTIYRDAIKASEVVPDTCPSKMVVLINRGHLWNKVSTLIEETVRMYIRYQSSTQERLPWGGICPNDPRATDWIEWWSATEHQWPTLPVEVYKNRRRGYPRMIRVSVSDCIPNGVSLI